MDITFKYTNNEDEDFSKLIELLDDDLYSRYGEIQKQYKVHNKVDYIKDVIIGYEDNLPVACGAFKEYETDTVELKRIFVLKEKRGNGYARALIKELEKRAASQNYKYAILETGCKQQEAIHLYQSLGFTTIPNYGPYVNDSNSICMKKEINN